MGIPGGIDTQYIYLIASSKKVGLIDADLIDNGTRHPNLALMKISSFCKNQSCEVELLESYDCIPDFDVVFVSCVFSYTKKPDNLESMPNVKVGGTGFFPDGGSSLPYCIEHSKPDYNLYKEYIEKQLAKGKKRSWFADYLDYSIGFTTRGCFRKCSFCVNKKFDKVHRHSSVVEFLDPSRPYIYLWDDNFFAYSGWKDVLEELKATNKPFQFRQGLDIRLLTQKKAEMISACKYKGDYIFAFDHIEDKDLIVDKLTLWRSITNKGTRLYVLCAYDSQDQTDIINTFERIKVLMEFGCLPYLMRYEDYKRSPFRSLYVNLARWCNQPKFFKKMSFRQFCEACQKYHKTPNTMCAAYKSMVDFEALFPDISRRYFDLRFEEVKRF